jgi:hypothetical protein
MLEERGWGSTPCVKFRVSSLKSLLFIDFHVRGGMKALRVGKGSKWDCGSGPSDCSVGLKGRGVGSGKDPMG